MSDFKTLINKLGLSDKIGVRDPNQPEQPPVMIDESKLPEVQEQEAQDLSSKQDLMERLKKYENSIQKGLDPVTGRYFPHRSIEGGKDTLAFGDKLLEGKYSPEELDNFYKYGMTKEQADDALMRNIREAEQGAERIMASKGIQGLDPVQKEALTEMVFQMGVSGTKGFPGMLKALQMKDYNKAYQEALDSKWAREDSPQRAREVASRLKFGKLAGRIAKK